MRVLGYGKSCLDGETKACLVAMNMDLHERVAGIYMACMAAWLHGCMACTMA